MTDKIDEIRRLLKNINTDEEIDEIHDILDSIDGSIYAKNPYVTGIAEIAAKKGYVQEVNVINEIDSSPMLGGGQTHYDMGPTVVDVSFAVDPRELYDD